MKGPGLFDPYPWLLTASPFLLLQETFLDPDSAAPALKQFRSAPTLGRLQGTAVIDGLVYLP